MSTKNMWKLVQLLATCIGPVAAIDPGQGRGMGGNSRKTTGLLLRVPPCGLEVRMSKLGRKNTWMFCFSGDFLRVVSR